MTAVARGYEFFTYYYTLAITPMFILSGVFYPTTALPEMMQGVIGFLPLTHAIAIIRPLVIGQPISDFWLHFSYLCVFGAVAMARRRLIIQPLLEASAGFEPAAQRTTCHRDQPVQSTPGRTLDLSGRTP